jgi:adenylate cyclase
MAIINFAKEKLSTTQLEALQQVEWRNERLIAHFRFWLAAIPNFVLDIFNACTSWQKFDVTMLLLFDLGIVLYALVTFLLTRGKYKPWVKNVLISTDIIVVAVYSYFSMPGALLPGFFILALILTVFRYRAFLTLIATLECVIAFILVIQAWFFLGYYPIWEMPGNGTLMMYSRFIVILNNVVLIGILGIIFAYISRQVKILVIRTIERESLSRFLPKELVNEVESGRLVLEKEGQRILVTVIFSDILNFNSLSERLKPEKIVYLLNRYTDSMVQIVFKQGGIIDRFTGDGLMAIFGAPLSSEDDQLNAVNTALLMKTELEVLNKEFYTSGLPTLKIGMGIATSEVIGGNIGSRDYMDYTVKGSAVNIAPQLQGYCRELGVEILAEETTVKAINGRINSTEVGSVQIFGNIKPLKVWTFI